MSFSSLAKEELLRLPLGKNCCVMSELSALVQTSGSLQLRGGGRVRVCLLYTSPSPRDLSTSRMTSSA